MRVTLPLAALPPLAAAWLAVGCTMGIVGTPDGNGEQTDDLETRSWHCEPVPEYCDGLDNDCNGRVDEGCPCDNGATQSCYPSDPATQGVGICAAGVQTCVNWQWSACEGYVTPSDEVCDGKDNNCDGNIDEGNAGGGNACLTGLPGVCADGMYVCAGGALSCTPLEAASAEICDGEDNDCDGVVDNGNPGGGAACATGLPGVCANGTMTCQGGTLGCVPTTAAAPEVCGDGLDNDCNGAVDDGCGCVHDPCAVGTKLESGCSSCVTQICASDPFCCSTSWDQTCVNEVSTICGESC